MEVSKSINLFLEHCQFEKNLSENTLLFYSVDLNQLLMFLNRQGVLKIGQIDRVRIKLYVQTLSKFEPRTIKRKIASSKAFLNFLEFEDHILVNPYRKIKIRIKEPKKLPTVLDFKEIRALMMVVKQQQQSLHDKLSYSFKEKVRDLAIIELLFATGMRVSELCGLRTQDINLTTGDILIHGKGNKQRISQICNRETVEVLKEYQGLFCNSIKHAGFFLSAG